jgi:cysteine dioxygenase
MGLDLSLLPPSIRPNPRALRAILLRFDRDEVEEAARFSLRGYSRIVLFRTRALELVLGCWLPGQASPIHDHGGSCGATLMLDGHLTEERFCLERGAARLGRRRVHGPGEVFLEGRETIHRVRNDSGRRALSLHLYAPPLAGLRTFVEARTARAGARAAPAGGRWRPSALRHSFH